MNPGVAYINHPCLVCYRSTSMWCSRCQNAWYCTPEHLQSVRRHTHERLIWDSSCARIGPVIAGNASLSHPCNLTRLPCRSLSNLKRLPYLRYSFPHRKVKLTALLGVYAYLAELPDRPRVITIACQPPHAPAQGACPTP